MDTISIPIKEYRRLLDKREGMKKEEKKGGFTDAAFGVFKGGFGKTSAVSYISGIRKAWRKP